MSLGFGVMPQSSGGGALYMHSIGGDMTGGRNVSTQTIIHDRPEPRVRHEKEEDEQESHEKSEQELAYERDVQILLHLNADSANGAGSQGYRRNASGGTNVEAGNGAVIRAPFEPFPEVPLDDVQVRLSFRILRQIPQAQAARRRVLDELLTNTIEFFVGRELREPNAHFLELYRNYWVRFMLSWYDWHMAIGVVPLRIIRLANGDFVPSVPNDDCRIHTFYDPERERQCFKYYRRLHTGSQREQLLFDESVVILADEGYNPSVYDGTLCSSLSSLIDIVWCMETQRVMNMKGELRRANPQMWLEDHGEPDKPSDSVDGVSYDGYGMTSSSRAFDDEQDDDDILQTLNNDELAERRKSRRMQSHKRMLDVDDDAHLFNISLSGKQLAALPQTAIAVLSSDPGSFAPKPLPAQTRVVQRQHHGQNMQYVDQQRFANESISSAFGVSSDMLTASSSQKTSGNVDGVQNTLQMTVVSLKRRLSQILTLIYRTIYAEERNQQTRSKIVNLIEHRPSPIVTSEDVFRAIDETRVTLKLPTLALLTTQEDLLLKFSLKLMEWPEFFCQSRRLSGLPVDEYTEIPKDPWPELMRAQLFYARNSALTSFTPLDVNFMIPLKPEEKPAVAAAKKKKTPTAS